MDLFDRLYTKTDFDQFSRISVDFDEFKYEMFDKAIIDLFFECATIQIVYFLNLQCHQ